jgi:PP-loop superfamily ATP-utilizing enzyme
MRSKKNKLPEISSSETQGAANHQHAITLNHDASELYQACLIVSQRKELVCFACRSETFQLMRADRRRFGSFE